MATEGSSYMSAAYRYYEGFLEKKGPKDKDFLKLWTVLRESTLYFYSSKVTNFNRDSTPVDTADLDMDCCPLPDKERGYFKFMVRCNISSKYRFKATSSEDRDNWIVKITAVTMGKRPEYINLLPGQIQDVNEIIAAEKQRKTVCQRARSKSTSLPSSSHCESAPPLPHPPRPPYAAHLNLSPTHSFDDPYCFYPHHLQIVHEGIVPPWFFSKLSRDHAEQILNKNTEMGDLLIRESETHPGEFSLSVRQESQNRIVVRHYRFKRQGDAFKMHIDDAHPPLSTMYDLINFFVEKSGGNLKPMRTNNFRQLKLPQSLYEEGFSLVYPKDPENGELRQVESPGDYLPPMIHQGSAMQHQSGYDFPIVRSSPKHTPNTYYNVPEQSHFDDVPSHPPPPAPARRQTVSASGPPRKPVATSLTRSATRPTTSHPGLRQGSLQHSHSCRQPCTTVRVDSLHDNMSSLCISTTGEAQQQPPNNINTSTDDNPSTYLEILTQNSHKS